jgi:hypothetical protein
MSLWTCFEDSKNTIKMEIQELIFYYLHEDTKTLEVNFRLTIDSEDEFRSDIIDLTETENFGYNIISDDLDILNEYYDEDLEDDDDWGESEMIDEQTLVSFLNEYYIVNPKKLPKPELI